MALGYLCGILAVPPPRRHVTVYVGVLSSQSQWRSRIVPKAAAEDHWPGQPGPGKPWTGNHTPRGGFESGGSVEKKSKAGDGRYIPWHELLRRTFGEEIVCPECGGAIGLIALVKTERTIQTILWAMHLPRVFHSPGPQKVVSSSPPRVFDDEDLERNGAGVRCALDGSGRRF